MQSKAILRQTMLDRRLRLTSAEVEGWSRQAQERLLGLPAFAEARAIALYWSARNEVRTDRLFEAACAARKVAVFPRLTPDRRAICFYPLRSPEELVPGPFGLLEPPGNGRAPVEPGALGLIVVPGLAFDRQGHRLGYGRGYYDRWLGEITGRPTLVGLAYAFQIVDQIPASPADHRMEVVVTDRGILPIPGGPGGADQAGTEEVLTN
ncbi:MAG: 5-formyltetrahydrofolate cyclo-ligase [Deltaproteobacteria bacterium]|nr:5-formyltetrahydrofolate cyclo-ligase [Deltaproteobacteria bacterium]